MKVVKNANNLLIWKYFNFLPVVNFLFQIAFFCDESGSYSNEALNYIPKDFWFKASFPNPQTLDYDEIWI